jgi:tetratricopeptide (TPR) repeat protein
MNTCLTWLGCGDGEEQVRGNQDYKRISFYGQNSSITLQDICPRLVEGTLLAQVEDLKDEGNIHFNNREDELAMAKYNEAIGCFTFAAREGQVVDDVKTEVELFTVLLSNRSACYLRTFKWQEALEDANGVLFLRPEWSKGYTRRGDALYGLYQYDQALEAYNQAASLERVNNIIQSKILRCNVHLEHIEQGLEVYQLFPGRDICINRSIFSPINNLIWDNAAIPLRNLIHIIVNRATREAAIIDACWDIGGILDFAKRHDINIVACLISHYHTGKFDQVKS